MKYRQLIALTTATVLAFSTAACGAKDIEDAPAGIQIETLAPEAEVQDSVDRPQQQAQEAQAPAEAKESEKTEAILSFG